jgi:hypothetical protein
MLIQKIVIRYFTKIYCVLSILTRVVETYLSFNYSKDRVNRNTRKIGLNYV